LHLTARGRLLSSIYYDDPQMLEIMTQSARAEGGVEAFLGCVTELANYEDSRRRLRMLQLVSGAHGENWAPIFATHVVVAD